MSKSLRYSRVKGGYREWRDEKCRIRKLSNRRQSRQRAQEEKDDALNMQALSQR